MRQPRLTQLLTILGADRVPQPDPGNGLLLGFDDVPSY
jgi:hypothetical protein